MPMGITSLIYQFEKKALEMSGKKYEGLNWCELGCQKYTKYNIPAKLMYKKLKVNHTSMDINGKFGSIQIDLAKDIPPKFTARFDIITDYGTIEHITKQYGVFKNIHIMCKVGGLMIHALPIKAHIVCSFCCLCA